MYGKHKGMSNLTTASAERLAENLKNTRTNFMICKVAAMQVMHKAIHADSAVSEIDDSINKKFALKLT